MCLSRCKTVKKQGKNLSLNNNQASKEPDSNGSNSNDSKKVIQQSLNANHDKLFEITDNHIDRNSKESEFEVSRVKIEDQDFYDNLQNFKPICYDGNGYAWFLAHNNWKDSIGGLIFLDVSLILSILLLVIMSKSNEELQAQNTVSLIILVDIIIFIVTNIVYLLTLFMNPGARNLTKITDDEYESSGRQYCPYCRLYRTQNMRHCRQCMLCVEDLDHHCGFFNKCVAGPQQHAFNACLFMMLCSFLACACNLVLALT